MAKVVKLDSYEVVIADDDRSLIRVPYEELDFKPEVHDEVEIFQDGDSLIVTKMKNRASSAEDGIHINIVNDNVQQQQQQQFNTTYVQAGKVVNKVVYMLLIFFLGWVGGHKFYAGKVGMGILYLVFAWTTIPAFAAFVELIMAAFKPSDANGNIIV